MNNTPVPDSGGGSTVPGSRKELLPLPPAAAAPTPEAGSIGDELVGAYWSHWDGEAARTSLWTIFRKLPAISHRVLGLAWRTDPRATVAVIVLQLGSAAMAAFGLLASVGVLQALFAEGATPDRIRAAGPSLALVAGLLMGRAVLDFGVSYAQATLTPQIQRAVEADFLRLTSHVRLEVTDDANWSDDSGRASDRGLYYTRQSITQILELASAVMGLAGAAGVLAILHPLLLIPLSGSVVPQGLAAVRSARKRFLSAVRQSTQQRRIRLFTWLLLDISSAVELRASTAQQALLDEHDQITRRREREERRLGREEARTGLIGRAVGGLATAGTYGALAWMTWVGWLPLAAGGGAVLAIRASQGTLNRIVMASHLAYEHALWIEDMYAFMGRCRAELPRVTGRTAPRQVETITVKHLTYRYPETEQPAVCDVSMTLRTGTTVAFVGANGSGKTTMSKLLAGLYDPTAGTITWDGVDLREYDAESIQSSVAMVLQDPVEWPFSALANITISEGTITASDPQRAHAAAADTGADRIIAAWPQQWRTPLSKRFKDGKGLSGGQWAKFAVARGLYKEAPLLLLDEPTANMDPRAEHEVYRSVLRGHRRGQRITVLISHRLASVVECEQIFVFHDGRIIESGDHPSLMARDGEYATLFNLQAAAYRAEAAAGGDMA